MKKLLFIILSVFFVLICVLSLLIVTNKKPVVQQNPSIIVVGMKQQTVPKTHFFAPNSKTLTYCILFATAFLAITVLGYLFSKVIFDFTKTKNVLTCLFGIRLFLVALYVEGIILFYLFCSAYTMIDLTGVINRPLDLATGVLLMIFYVPYYVASLTNLVFPILFLIIGVVSLLYLKNNKKDFYAIMYGFNSIVLLIILNFFVVSKFIG